MRSDDDTWDITSSVGSTALFVAAARALEAARPEPVAVDPFAEVFCRAVGGEWADLLDGREPDNRLATGWGSSFVDYQAARTRFFDEYFEAAAQAGVRQIVVLAAGLDSRAYRLNWPAGTTVYELDQPQVLDFKRRTLASHGATARAAVVEVPVDLRDDWPAALRSAGLDQGRPSAWIAEGLLIYLPAAAQATLFAGLDSLAAPGSHVAVEDTTPMPAPAFEAAREREIADGEEGSFFTLVYNEQHQPAADWFADHGWRTDPVALPALLDSLGRPLSEAGDHTDFMIESVTLMRAVKD